MESKPSPPSAVGRRDWARFAFPCVLALVCLALYLWRLGAIPLEDFDEAYYAVGAREMLQRHDLGTPYFNGHPFLLKPILIYWVIAASFAAFGVTEFAARLPSALFGTLTVLATYWFAARTVSRRAGFLAGLSLALCYLWIDISRDASIDALLAVLIAPALFLFFLGASQGSRRGRRLQVLCYPLLGLALLAKGPIPVGVVLVGLFAFLVGAGQLAAALRRQLLPGLAITLAVTAPWYLYELRHQPDFFATFFVGEHFGHVGGTLARQEPVWGNLRYLLLYFYPWVAFLPAALAHAFRQPRSHVLRFASWWAIAVVVLFSIPRSKLAHYLAPAFPPLAILVGAWLDQWMSNRQAPRWSLWVPRTVFGAAGIACLALAFAAVFAPALIGDRVAERYGDWAPGSAPTVMLGLLGLGSCAAAALAGARRRLVVALLALSMVAAAFVHVGWFRARLAAIQAQPREDLARYASRVLSASQPLGVYYAKRNSTIFYFQRPIVDLGETDDEFAGLVAFLSASRPSTVLTHRKLLPDLEARQVPVFLLRDRGDFVLVANHPVGERATSAGPR